MADHQDIQTTVYVDPEELAALKQEKFRINTDAIYSGRKRGAFLVILTGPAKGKVFGLYQGTKTIGRDSNADIVLPESRVSKRHAEMVISGNSATIKDSGSTNGTLVNDKPVKQARLKDKDEIKIGHSLLQYFCIDLNADDEKKEVPAGEKKIGSAFYLQVLNEIKPHFGRMSNRFLDRQISAHVGKTPQAITVSDKETLAKWINISAGLLLGEDVADNLVKKILALK